MHYTKIIKVLLVLLLYLGVDSLIGQSEETIAKLSGQSQARQGHNIGIELTSPLDEISSLRLNYTYNYSEKNGVTLMIGPVLDHAKAQEFIGFDMSLRYKRYIKKFLYGFAGARYLQYEIEDDDIYYNAEFNFHQEFDLIQNVNLYGGEVGLGAFFGIPKIVMIDANVNLFYGSMKYSAIDDLPYWINRDKKMIDYTQTDKSETLSIPNFEISFLINLNGAF